MQSLASSVPLAPLALGKTVRRAVRSMLAIAAISLVCAAALSGRCLAFEYGYGDGGMASHLFDTLS